MRTFTQLPDGLVFLLVGLALGVLLSRRLCAESGLPDAAALPVADEDAGAKNGEVIGGAERFERGA